MRWKLDINTLFIDFVLFSKDTLAQTLEPDADPLPAPKNLVSNPWNGLLRTVETAGLTAQKVLLC